MPRESSQQFSQTIERDEWTGLVFKSYTMLFLKLSLIHIQPTCTYVCQDGFILRIVLRAFTHTATGSVATTDRCQKSQIRVLRWRRQSTLMVYYWKWLHSWRTPSPVIDILLVKTLALHTRSLSILTHGHQRIPTLHVYSVQAEWSVWTIR